MASRLSRIQSRWYWRFALLLKVKNALLLSWWLWDDAYGMVQYKNAIIQYRHILVGWARNVLYPKTTSERLTQSDKSPRFWMRGLKVGLQDDNPTISKM
jgi:hypothetical protein